MAAYLDFDGSALESMTMDTVIGIFGVSGMEEFDKSVTMRVRVGGAEERESDGRSTR